MAAIRAAQLGMNVACVETDKLGGVCLNVGCIPTKALLSSAHLVGELQHAEGHGITLDGMTIDLGPAQVRSRAVSDQLNRGVGFLFKKHSVTHVEGYARLTAPGRIEVQAADGSKETVAGTPILKIDGDRIWSSTEALFQTKAPDSLAVVGAGAVGMEFADIYQAFGTKVTVIEALDRVLPLEDKDSSSALARSYKKRGIDVHTSAMLQKTEVGDSGVRLTVKDKKGEEKVFEVEYVLSAVGRTPNSEDVGLDAVGAKLTEQGFVAVDDRLRTNVEGIYSVGDCAGPPMLAHKASHEGIVAVEHMAGEDHGGVDYGNIPNCTYCHPEVASVGLTEAQEKEAGYEIEVGKFPWQGNGRALAAGDTEGFVKVIRGKEYSEILGAHIVGAQATELIAEFVIGRHLESTAEEMEKAMHPHVAEGALASLGRPIHI